MTTRFHIACDLDYMVSGDSEFVFNVQAAQHPQQRVISETLEIQGGCGYREHASPDLGNRFVRTRARQGSVRLRYRTELRVVHVAADPGSLKEVPVALLPIEALPFVLPSRYCQSDRMLDMAVRTFGTVARGADRVAAVCDWVHSHVRFAPGSTNVSTSATDVLVQGKGVCRDFAHLTIALLRALNVPARFVTGYDYGVDPSYGPTDFHAYVEAFLSDRWWIFDATKLAPRNGLVRIGTGRDAADCAFATIFGPARFEGMRLDIAPIGGPIVDDGTRALSTARLEDALRWSSPPPLYGDYLAAA